MLLIIFRQPGANIIDTVDAITTLLPTLRASIPPSINLSIVLDRTTTIRASVHDVELTLLISIVLVILVVFVFLRSVRSTLIPSVAVPVSLIGTFGVMYLFGYSLDNLSLMALTIATGFVVDDAIVVIENITRHLEHGATPLEAALLGAREIGFTVLSISISLVAVFIPILLMGGIVGRLFREFAVTLSVAIVVSMLVSLTTTPMMCARLLKSHDEERHGRVYRASERAFDWILARYAAVLRWVLRHQPLTLAAALVTMVATIYLYVVIPKGFFPQQDTGRLTGTLIADQDTSFQAMQRRVVQFADIVRQDPAVDGVVAYAGGGGLGGGSAVNTARVNVNLKDSSERRLSADQVIARLRGKLARLPGATLYFQADQDLRVGGRRSSAQYQYTLSGRHRRRCSTSGRRARSQSCKTLPQLADVNSDQQTQGLQASLAIDRRTASRLGISPQKIDDTLYDAFGQRQVSTMYTPLNQYHVVMEVDPQFWQNPDSLQIHLRARRQRRRGAAERVHALSSRRPRRCRSTIRGSFPSVTISFNLPPGVALGDAVDAIQSAEREIGLPPGDPRQLRRHGAGLPGLAGQRAAADRGGAGHRLHRARRAVRELHPPDHDSLDAAVGRRRRAAGADAVPHRADRDRADRDHPADRHREEERDHDDRLRARGRAQ